VVSDGVQRLCLSASQAAGQLVHFEQFGIEDRFLGGGVQFEERRETGPEGAQRAGVRGVDLLEHGELPALLVMVVKDQLGDVHSSSRRGEPTRPAAGPRRPLSPAT
jgi:hypothetical protein